MYEQFAYRVAGPSMNLRGINDGDYILAVPYWNVRTSPQDGDLAVIERSRDGGEVERTVKEIVVEHDVIKLMPRSSDPAYQEPIVIPRHLERDTFERVAIIALVIGAYRSFFKP
jgi:SOS-response transcriptional repressor LexA